MRISYDHDTDAAYIRLARPTPAAHHVTTRALTPEGVDGFIALDWEADRLIGIEILDASSRLPNEVLEQADQPS